MKEEFKHILCLNCGSEIEQNRWGKAGHLRDAQKFCAVLREVQEYISSKYSTLILDGGKDEVKTQVKRYISTSSLSLRWA